MHLTDPITQEEIAKDRAKQRAALKEKIPEIRQKELKALDKQAKIEIDRSDDPYPLHPSARKVPCSKEFIAKL